MNTCEVVVIGAGPGGYAAALALGRGGVKTVLIDRAKARLGGVCLNEGCIPAKHYLEAASYASRVEYFRSCGIGLECTGLELGRLRAKTEALKNEIRSGVAWMLEQAGVTLLEGTASFVDAQTVEVAGERIGFGHCIIATGSRAREVPELPTDGRRILSSSDIFALERLPASIAIVGGGPIGCEFATFFSAFGTEVTLIGRRPQLLPAEDAEVGKALLRAFKKRGIAVMTSTEVEKAEVDVSGVALYVAGESSGQLRCDAVLCAAGRLPNTEFLRAENAGVSLDEKGFVTVDAAFRTARPHIYAVGDCIATPAFAHTATAEGEIAARNILGGGNEANTHITPATAFTDPPVASCGLQEHEAVARGEAVEIRKAFFKANAKAKIGGDDSGFAKMVVSADSGIVLGASIIGAGATEVIHEMVLAVEKRLTARELREMIFAHPTHMEIVKYL